MIYAKETRIGIDQAIYNFQVKLEDLGLNDTDVYGRLYVNRKKNASIAEAYVSNGEYKEIFLDDRKTGVFGFIVDGTRDGFDVIKTDVRLIGSFNLDTLYGNTTRNDEELLLLVLNAITGGIKADNRREIQTEMEDVFRGLEVTRISFRNMQPWFNFSIAFKLSYVNNICDILPKVRTI